MGSLVQGRRAFLWVAAAALTAGSLLVPLWGFRMSAPQYPGESLHLRVTPTAITGDVHEVTTLQKYIGVRFPTRLPELRWLRPALLALAALLLAAAIPARGRGTRFLRLSIVAVFAGVLLFSGALVQKRLYEVGHERDPHAPIRAVHDFTPPAVGPVKVGNFTVWSYPHVGACFLVAALALAAAAGVRRPERFAA